MSGCHVPNVCTCKCHVSSNECCDQCTTISIEMIHEIKENIDTWKKNHDSYSMMLTKRILDLEYRLNNIVEFPTELDVRLQDVERIVDKLGESFCKLKKEFENRISYLEEFRQDTIDWILEKQEKIRLMDESIDSLECFKSAKLNKPHKCPVCDLTGAIQLETAEELARYCKTRMRTDDGKWFIWCKSCQGKGILWG